MAAWLHKGDETVLQYELLPKATKQDVETKGQKSKTGHEPFVGKRKGILSQRLVYQKEELGHTLGSMILRYRTWIPLVVK